MSTITTTSARPQRPSRRHANTTCQPCTSTPFYTPPFNLQVHANPPPPPFPQFHTHAHTCARTHTRIQTSAHARAHTRTHMRTPMPTHAHTRARRGCDDMESSEASASAAVSSSAAVTELACRGADEMRSENVIKDEIRSAWTRSDQHGRDQISKDDIRSAWTR